MFTSQFFCGKMNGIPGSSLSRRSFLEFLILSVLGLVFSVCALSFSSYVFHISENINNDEIIPFLSGKPIPSKYIINDSVLSPILNQGVRGTCWAFQVIGILETQYKQQGLDNGYLKPNEYLQMSTEGLAVDMVKKCLDNPKSLPCICSMRSENTTTGGSLQEFVKFVDYWPEFKNYVVPSSCCPYQILPENEMVCPNLDKCKKNNPLEFEILQSFSTTNINDAKQRLYETQVPLAFSINNPQHRYIFPCTNPIVSNSSSCVMHDFICPYNMSEYCSILDFKFWKASDAEFLFHNTGKVVPGTGHATLLVGYNDNFVPKRALNFSKLDPPVGGFILKNTWGPRGHTFEYDKYKTVNKLIMKPQKLTSHYPSD